MKCKHCGAEIPNDSNFCEFCGIAIRNSCKKVDIRWLFLPAMILSIFATYIALINFGERMMLLLPISPLLLFIVSVVYGIKKSLRPSFVILMGVLLSCHLMMFSNYVLDKKDYPECTFECWFEDEESCCLTIENGPIFDLSYETIQKQAEQLQQKLQREGVTSDREDRFIRWWTCYGLGWTFVFGWQFAILSLFLYLIYAFFASKKDWNF